MPMWLCTLSPSAFSLLFFTPDIAGCSSHDAWATFLSICRPLDTAAVQEGSKDTEQRYVAGSNGNIQSLYVPVDSPSVFC